MTPVHSVPFTRKLFMVGGERQSTAVTLPKQALDYLKQKGYVTDGMAHFVLGEDDKFVLTLPVDPALSN